MRLKTLFACSAATAGAVVLAGACGGRTLEDSDFSPDAGDNHFATGGGRPIPPGFGGQGAGPGVAGFGGQGGEPSCFPPMASCGGICVDVARNSNHCGTCFSPCGVGESCVAGICRSGGSTDECLPNETRCSNWGCIDLSSNIFACGDCYSYCSNGERCIDGVCVYGTCINGGTFCEASPDGGSYSYSSCVTDFSTDWAHCGACNNQCGDYEYCENGQCVRPTCDDYCYYDGGTCNYIFCEQSGCTDIATDLSNCGGCQQSCTGSRSLFTWDAHVCNNGTCACSSLATPCGSGCAVRFSYCPPAGYTGSELELCNTLARTAYDRCGCGSCLDSIRACAADAACINAMDCALQSPCIGCSEPFYSCYDQYSERNALADALVACLNQNCANP